MAKTFLTACESGRRRVAAEFPEASSDQAARACAVHANDECWHHGARSQWLRRVQQWRCIREKSPRQLPSCISGLSRGNAHRTALPCCNTYMTIPVVVSASMVRVASSEWWDGGRRSTLHVSQITSWYSACGDVIRCPSYHLHATLHSQRDFETSHGHVLGPTGSQDVTWYSCLSLPDPVVPSSVTYPMLNLAAPKAPSADLLLRPSASS